jgi:Tol biopolymer transport system component
MKSGITLIDADGSNQRQLTTDSYVADHGIGVVWSPRGDQIAYQRNRTGCEDASSSPCYEGSEVVLVTATVTDPKNAIGSERVIPPLPPEVSLDEPWNAHSVTWSPDGTHLLYSAGVQGLIAVPVDAAQPPSALSGDGLTGIQEEHATSPWVPLQQWQPSLTTRHSSPSGWSSADADVTR